MKNILFSITLLTCLMWTSCIDLTETPESILSPESFYNTESDLQAAIVACYNPFLNKYEGVDVRSWSMHMGADDMTSRNGANKTRLLDPDRFVNSPDNIDNYKYWTVLYKIIANCNMVIANYEKVSMDKTKRNQLIAQAFFLRSYAYFCAVKFWGDIPLITKPLTTDLYGVRRNSKEKVYEQIIADAKFAETNLPLIWKEQPGAATKGAAKTLLADVYLTMAGWPLKQTEKYADAANKAKEVIDLGLYNLVDDYKDLYNLGTKNNKEHIWNIQANRELGYDSKFGITFLPPDEHGWSDYVAEIKFFNNMPDNYRKEVTYYTVFTVKGKPVKWQDGIVGKPYFSKYWDTNEARDKKQASGSHLFPVYRYAEVLLIYAEAQNKISGGPSASCYDAINKIRRRANKNIADDAPIGLNELQFDQLVFDEKGWEFAAEQKRWFDLVRKELVEKYNEGNPDIITTITKQKYLFPIPSQELDRNPQLGQNPGY
ncbi:RagB/SusD family nutrient uptake outer membrane protein [Halosquirtibacter xylanolyticus]|uniref:RagB/SusD family nutrient uptake outer membrane protein n=1 Tax=Halosquirtibacter xylanolyticus TaxID=3374599 RepID=UPI003747FC68|nr:RagB/SusD family nutrient uptake outer membrane protein [Prolixibacteraceae bacterium]